MINLIIILFGLSLLYISAISRLEGYIKALAFQGFLLTILVLNSFGHLNPWNFAFLILETLGFKAIIIPQFLMRTIRENEISRETEPYISHFYSLLFTSLIFALGFFLAYWAREHVAGLGHLHFGISISTIVFGLFIILTRKKLITHTMGFMIVENGIFLLSLSKVHEMPMIVNTGVLLDIFLVVLLLGIFINKIESTIENPDVDRLTYLKD